MLLQLSGYVNCLCELILLILLLNEVIQLIVSIRNYNTQFNSISTPENTQPIKNTLPHIFSPCCPQND